ncbi:MAG: hypothetical protein IIW75_02155 [Bacteroidaceae bacterium]|nr:hypothetical protein [Bacteroidaceae bacterium]
MKKLLPLLLLPLFLSCVTQERVERATLIAHAGGAIDSCVYTNSREALELAIKNGYSFIEFDFQFTSDSVMVAAHSWSDFNHMTDSVHLGETAPCYNDFKSRRICGRYTPLSAREINDFFEFNDSLFLVTDKVSNPELLHHYFPNLKDRMVVEAFSYEDYLQLSAEGYYRVLYSCMASDVYATLLKNLLFDRLFPGERIEWLAVHTSAFNVPFFKFINKVRKFNIALFTVDDLDSIPCEHAGRATMIYTNHLLP